MPGACASTTWSPKCRNWATIDEATFNAVRRIIFDPDAGKQEPEYDRRQAAVLLETMKDLLTQTYVRRAKLRQALKVRRFFANQAAGIDEDEPELPVRKA